jgi:diguanylate cyclase (GGDEF)-like protein
VTLESGPAEVLTPPPPRRRFRLSFRNRILGLFILLIGLIQLATFAVVEVAIKRSVQMQLHHELEVGERVWSRFHEARGRQLIDSVSLLSDDFGFREAVASADPPTMLSAMSNHGARIGATAGLLLAPDGTLLVAQAPGDSAAQQAALSPLLEIAREEGFAYGVIVLDGQPMQLAVVPVMAPNHIAWVVAGGTLDAATAQDYRALTGLDVSFARRDHTGGLRIVASSLSEPEQDRLRELDAARRIEPEVGSIGTLEWQGLFVRTVAVSARGAEPVVAFLQASWQQAMVPFDQLKNRILGLSAGAALLALIVAGVLGRGVSRPVAQLADAATRIEKGDYTQVVETGGGDELGRLASMFNRMQSGIAQREDRILYQASHDGLTGLPNRTRAMQELETAIARAQRERGHCAVLLLDLDRFKEINDTLGHGFGDQVLIEVAKRLREAVRPEDRVARLGGDEFLVLMEGLGSTHAGLRARELSDLLREPLLLPSTQIGLEVSIGVAIYPEHGESAEVLLRRGDIAMYEAKERHAGVAIYTPGRDEQHLRQVSLMADLRRSLERGELSLVFQPKLDVSGSQVRHAEALLRWTHPEHGPIPPDEFIPLAERSGFVTELSRFVLDSAVGACRQWRDAGLDLGVAVNLSAIDLMDAALPDAVYDCLRRHRLSPAHLILEVTESALMRDVEYAIRVLQRLRGGGVHIAIDDFGTGHSSLAQLKRLPIDELKIDKSFVQQLALEGDDAAIVRATIDLGHHMGLRIVAEGVEDARSLALLRDYRCDLVQGYLFSAPLRPSDFVAWCRAHGQVGTQFA